MSPTTRFFILTIAGALISGAIVLLSRSVGMIRKLAWGFYLLAIALRVGLLVITCLAISVISAVTYSQLAKILSFPGFLVIGAGLASVGFVLWQSIRGPQTNSAHDRIRHWLRSPYLLKGLSFYVALAFIAAEIGKISYLAQMREFFHESGYADWFLYSIISLETIGAIGLLIRASLIPGAALLSVIMLGAIYTHYRNGDPFGDSLAALHLLIVCLCIVILRGYQTHTEAKGYAHG